MADKLTQSIVDALTRAAAEPSGLPLYTSRSETGLFASTSATKPAVRRCLEEGLLVTFLDSSTRPARELCRITEKGTQFLIDHASPKQVLDDFVRVLEAKQSLGEEILRSVRQMNDTIAGMKETLGALMPQVVSLKTTLPRENERFPCLEREATSSAVQGGLAVATVSVAVAILTYLADWSSATGAGPDCPLPDLFRGVSNVSPEMSIGQFHDHLRELQASGRVYLHPWTGPLYTLPEPTYAILVGHNIAYYASIRK